MNDVKIFNDKKMKNLKLVDFKALEILLANKDDVMDWSYGEVTKPETINYRTLRPEKDGLFDERIFGPTKDWECYCGKYKRIRYKGIICDKCGVEVTLSRVRRERMGHIKLSSPVAHVWFFKGASSALSTVLDISQKNLESVIYYASYLVVGIDEEKKKEALENLSKNIEKRKTTLALEKDKEEEKLTKEAEQKTKEAEGAHTSEDQKKLIKEEVALSLRQKVARLSERFDADRKSVV